MSKLSDLLLSSGFSNPWDPSATTTTARCRRCTTRFSRRCSTAACCRRTTPRSSCSASRATATQDSARQQLEELIQQIIERMGERGLRHRGRRTRIASGEHRQGAGGGRRGQRAGTFEVTDKALDFLGYRALRDLLGSVGRSSVGPPRHARPQRPASRPTAAPKPYEFGDTLNLDAAAHRSSTPCSARPARHRDGGATAGGTGIDVDYEDLMVAQGDYQSSCATVIMLDCSHSMILYGEDRFTPAKRVALALSHLIRHAVSRRRAATSVLFHDSAEEIPLQQLGRVRVGPYYTNTREGLRLARRILERQRKDMRQIVMITDGKPSALTRPDGRIYQQRLRPRSVHRVARRSPKWPPAGKAGIMINTFMLARDYDLVAFVRRVARDLPRQGLLHDAATRSASTCLLDYMTKKTRTVH